jgi:NAD(P)-dependent dehydrogenase (short-subunit alcohol dehydrogenase family)
MGRLDGRRVLVVGASRGIGLAIGKHLDRQGARVAFAARSIEQLQAAVTDSHGDALALACNVMSHDDCRAVVERTVVAFGGLDALVYSAGAITYGELADTEAEDWEVILETNLLGAARITRQALRWLTEARGHAIYFSSISVSHVPPWRGLGLYIISKTALERMTRCWEVENPAVAFTNLIVGTTATEFGTNDAEGAARFGAEWTEKGYLSTDVLSPETHALAVAELLSSPARVDSMTLRPRQ